MLWPLFYYSVVVKLCRYALSLFSCRFPPAVGCGGVWGGPGNSWPNFLLTSLLSLCLKVSKKKENKQVTHAHNLRPACLACQTATRKHLISQPKAKLTSFWTNLARGCGGYFYFHVAGLNWRKAAFRATIRSGRMRGTSSGVCANRTVNQLNFYREKVRYRAESGET